MTLSKETICLQKPNETHLHHQSPRKWLQDHLKGTSFQRKSSPSEQTVYGFHTMSAAAQKGDLDKVYYSYLYFLIMMTHGCKNQLGFVAKVYFYTVTLYKKKNVSALGQILLILRITLFTSFEALSMCLSKIWFCYQLVFMKMLNIIHECKNSVDLPIDTISIFSM